MPNSEYDFDCLLDDIAFLVFSKIKSHGYSMRNSDDFDVMCDINDLIEPWLHDNIYKENPSA